MCDLIREDATAKRTKMDFNVLVFLVSFSDMQQLLHASKLQQQQSFPLSTVPNNLIAFKFVTNLYITQTNRHTRVGTLIVATIYLQLIQNRYMFRSFTVLQCSYQYCVQPVASDVEVVGYI